MLGVLKARFLAETLSTHDAEEADRGSDHGDCMSVAGVAGVASDNEPASDNEDCTELNILDDDFDSGSSIRM